MKHLLKLMDLSEKEIVEILNLADQLKYEKKNLEDKLDTKIDYDKSRMKELDDLTEKLKEKLKNL